MVRQITATVPPDQAEDIRRVLKGQKYIHNVNVYHGTDTAMVVFKVVNKKTDEACMLLTRYGVGNAFGQIDVVALASTKPRISTLRAVKKAASKSGELSRLIKKRAYRVSDRMSYDEMFDMIDGGTHLTFDYLALIFVGALICAMGLLTDSSVSVVASMLVSPLMGPIVGMTFGTVINDREMLLRSFVNELWGVLVCFLVSVVVGVVVGFSFNAESDLGPLGDNTQMSSRGQIVGLAWGAGVAIPSGLGVALGVSSYQISALIGVAISAALLPPIVNSGVCLAATPVYYFQQSHGAGWDSTTQKWFKTGLISMVLFVMNWILIYCFGLVMFYMKRLDNRTLLPPFVMKLGLFNETIARFNMNDEMGTLETFRTTTPDITNPPNPKFKNKILESATSTLAYSKAPLSTTDTRQSSVLSSNAPTVPSHSMEPAFLRQYKQLSQISTQQLPQGSPVSEPAMKSERDILKPSQGDVILEATAMTTPSSPRDDSEILLNSSLTPTKGVSVVKRNNSHDNLSDLTKPLLNAPNISIPYKFYPSDGTGTINSDQKKKKVDRSKLLRGTQA